MKSTAKFILALVITAVLKLAFRSVIPSATYYFLSHGFTEDRIRGAVEVIGSLFILTEMIVCGVWLYAEAKAEKENPWLWCLFGSTAKLMGIVLFFVYIMRKKAEANQTSRDNA